MTDFNELFGGSRSRYNALFRNSPRERDKLGLSLIEEVRSKYKNPIDIVDFGAGWGNFALLVQNKFPDSRVSGIEIDPLCVEAWKSDLELNDMPIHDVNILDSKLDRQWDLALTAAVTCMFRQQAFEKLMAAITGLINIGGYYIGWEMFHDIEQNLEVNEILDGKTDILCVRSTSNVRTVLQNLGFEDIRFLPFEMPFDLSPVENAVPWSGDNSDIDLAHLKSHTVQTDRGRYCFRGGLYQPWCNVIARKAH